MVWDLLLQLCVVKVTDDFIDKKYIFAVKTVEMFSGIVQTKLNYESIVERRGFKAQSFLKKTPDEISEAAPALGKTCQENIL